MNLFLLLLPHHSLHVPLLPSFPQRHFTLLLSKLDPPRKEWPSRESRYISLPNSHDTHCKLSSRWLPLQAREMVLVFRRTLCPRFPERRRICRLLPKGLQVEASCLTRYPQEAQQRQSVELFVGPSINLSSPLPSLVSRPAIYFPILRAREHQ
jgi:hypothetical protein